MLTGATVWSVIEHIIPVYAILMFGYGLYKLQIVKPVHMPGIGQWVSAIGVPAYIIHLLAFNDPYQISIRLVGADALQKLVALVIGCLWWKFTKMGRIDHLIRIFQLSTLPNTVLVGQALLVPLYGEFVQVGVVTIIFMQCFLWYNLAIALYELRIVLLEMKAKQPSVILNHDEENGKLSQRSISVVIMSNSTLQSASAAKPVGFDKETIMLSSDSAFIERTSSAPARVSFARILPITREPYVLETPTRFFQTDSPESHINSKEGDGTDRSRRSIGELINNENMMGAEIKKPRPVVGHEQDGLSLQDDSQVEALDTKQDVLGSGGGGQRTVDSINLKFLGIVFVKVLHRLKYSTMTYSSLIGFVYSLLAFKFHWTMPYYVRTSLELISDGAIGVAIFIIGTTWATSGRLISCGPKKMLSGLVLRFVVGPLIMVVTSLCVGLKGDNYRFAVVQAVIPQGVITFVLAREYGLDVNEFITAVVFQLLIFLPFVIAYYSVLEKL